MLDFLKPIIQAVVSTVVSSIASEGVHQAFNAINPPPTPQINISGGGSLPTPPQPGAGNQGQAKAPTAMNFSGGFTGLPPATPSGPLKAPSGGGGTLAPGGFTTISSNKPQPKGYL